jgi:hypothetical protein
MNFSRVSGPGAETLVKTSLLVLISVGSASPLFAFALFLPTTIDGVSAGVMDSALGLTFTPDYRSDTAPLPPTCSLSRLHRCLHCNLHGWILRRSYGATRLYQCVRVLALVWKSGRLKLPIIFLGISGHNLKLNRMHGLT